MDTRIRQGCAGIRVSMEREALVGQGATEFGNLEIFQPVSM